MRYNENFRPSDSGGDYAASERTFRRQAGGAELNVAAGAALLGLRTGIITKLPANNLGKYIRNCITACGLSTDYLIYDTEEDARLGVYYYEFGASPRI